MYVSLVELAERPGALELAQAATPERFRTVDAALLDALLRDQDVSSWPAEEVEVAELTKQAIAAEVDAAGGLIDGFLARRGYATLIAAGYGDAERIGKLTERQLLMYYEAELRRQRRARAEFLTDANMAFAGGKDAEQHLKALLK
ncbi:hypothetical protein ACOQNP_18130 [Ectopseudomonas khazarica]|uniref:hypothetical protein n=1 Tax=Ectopseudomonas khazarica TaxID=2502979 RepID=UPI003B95BE46